MMDVIVGGLIAFLVFRNGLQLLLLVMAACKLRHVDQGKILADLPHVHSGLEPPISLLLPVHDQMMTVVAKIQSLLALNYPEFEIVVINDGSTDSTIDVLKDVFELLPFPEAYRIRLSTQPIHAIYRSTRYPQLRVLDKSHGGRADALNAGINASRYPLICAMDAAIVMERDCLHTLAMPFLADAHTIGAIAPARLWQENDKLLSRLQSVEHLRNEQFEPLGWAMPNLLLNAPHGLHLLRKEAVMRAGGYNVGALSSDSELVMRLHGTMDERQQRYRISVIAEPVGWRAAADDIQDLKQGAVTAQKNMVDALRANTNILFGRHSRITKRIAYALLAICEWFGPAIEAGSYIIVTVAFLSGALSLQAGAAFFIVAIGMGMLESMTALLLEEMSFRSRQKPSMIGSLIVAAVVENAGYRQVHMMWRALGSFHARRKRN